MTKISSIIRILAFTLTGTKVRVKAKELEARAGVLMKSGKAAVEGFLDLADVIGTPEVWEDVDGIMDHLEKHVDHASEFIADLKNRCGEMIKKWQGKK